jgi:hypothetical protein
MGTQQINDYFSRQEKNTIPILRELRQMLLNASPALEERFIYKAPFYYYFGVMCYLHVSKTTVNLGFCNGFELSNEQNLLEAKDRNTIKTISFSSIQDLKNKEKQVKEIIQEAMLLRELKHKKKIRKI